MGYHYVAYRTEAELCGRLFLLTKGFPLTVKRLHVSLDDDVHMATKLFSTYMNITINEVMSKAIIHYLQNQTDYEMNEHLTEEIVRLTDSE